MNDKFEQYIKSQRPEFDPHKAPEGLWKGIEDGLEKKETRFFIGRVTRRTLSMAATLLIIAASALVIQAYRLNSADSELQTSQLYPELHEAEVFYKAKVEKRMHELEGYKTTVGLPAQEVIGDVHELENAYSELRKDLKDHANNEEVINAMIQNYRIRLAMLEQLLQSIEKDGGQNEGYKKENNTQEKTTNKDENVNI